MCYYCVGEWAEQVWACLYPSYGLGRPCDSPCRTKTTSAYTSGPVFTSLSLSSWPLWRLQDWVSEERVSDRQRIVRQKKLVKLRWHTCWPVRTDEKSEHSIVNWSEPQVSRERGQAQPTEKTPVLTSKAPKKEKKKEIHCVATTSLASKSIPKSHFIINYSLADCIWWPSFRRFSLTKKEEVTEQEGKERKKEKNTYLLTLRALREMEKLLLSLSLLSEDSTSDCAVESESSELSSKRKSMLEASMYYMQFCFCTMSVFFYSLLISKSFSPWFFPQQNVSNDFSQLFNLGWKSSGYWFDTFWENNQGEIFFDIKPPLTNLNISKSVETFVIKLFFDVVIKILEFDVVHLIFIIFRSAFPFLR